MTEYLTPKDLAKRYGISLWTLQQWRKKTRKGEATGPPFEDIGLTPLKPYAPRIRYKLTDVLSWEAANNIQPQSSN
jgi:transposase-like protein|tara:strand:+ start:310 stop:537 length:228 start_codon:yes stop_codon:yes gene_type:complete